MLNLDCHGVTSRQAILDALKEKVASTPAVEWIEGDGWNELIWEDSKELITRRELDEIAPDNPLILLHMSAHTVAANSRAPDEVGYTKDTPQPEGGENGPYDDGEINGMDVTLYRRYLDDWYVGQYSSLDELKAAQSQA